MPDEKCNRSTKPLIDSGAEVDLAPVREQLQTIAEASPDELKEWHVHRQMVSEARRMLGEMEGK